MEQVEEICDHIVLINSGKKILDGTVHDIKQSFKKNIYQIGAAIASDLPNTNMFEVVKQDNNRIQLKLNAGVSPNEVLQHFINQGVAIQSFNELLPSINDIFIQLVEDSSKARAFQTISLSSN